MNLFDPISVLAAHQRALQIEKQLERSFGGGLLTGTGSNTGRVSRATSNSGPSQHISGSGSVQRAPPTVTPTNRASTSEVRCSGVVRLAITKLIAKSRVRRPYL